MQYLAITNCRVSSDEQLKNNSLNRQKASVIEAAKKLNVKIPSDGQWSGSVSSKRGRNYDRKDIKEMLEYCKKHKNVRYLIVDEPDRFMRSIDEAFYWEVEFRNRVNVQIYYACDESLNTDNLQAKMMRFVKYFAAEGSNEERQRKSISGDTKAILEGRYPFHPKLGYMKGDIPGVHKLKPGLGELIKSLLVRLATGLVGLSESLDEFNKSSFVKNGEHCPYKMDKWRKIVVDPYYCGIVEMNKQVKVRNEHGQHKPLITKEQHLKIIEIVNGRQKNQKGPSKNGNPDFPLNTITLCENCFCRELKLGRYGRSNRGKFVGFKHGNGRTKKIYKRYRCRVCGRSILRDELHDSVQKLLNSFDLTNDGRQNLVRNLNRVWGLEERERKNQETSLRSELNTSRKTKESLILKLASTSNPTVSKELEKAIEMKVETISDLESRLDNLQTESKTEKERFLDFALDFADNLGTHFFELTPQEVKRCKELLFPEGFFVQETGKVYTTQISPFYRLRETKNGSFEPVKAQLVLHQGKCLHKIAPAPCPEELDNTAENRQIIIEEVRRWQVILSVSYANFELENHSST